MSDLILIVVIGIILFIIFKYVKPYFIKYDTTIVFTGGLGSGKSLNSVKVAVSCYKKNLLKWRIKKLFILISNYFNKIICHIFNKKKLKLKVIPEKPLLYSNIPIRLGKKQSVELNINHLILNSRISEYSVVFIDEFPQVLNQFDYNLEVVKNECNEFITYFRHYIGGYLVVNAQSIEDITVQFRRKLNSYYWCYDFKKFLFFFYTMRIMNNRISDNEVSTTADFIEDNSKRIFGVLPRGLYNSRAYSKRYDKVKLLENVNFNRKDLKTEKIIRFGDKKSKLD